MKKILAATYKTHINVMSSLGNASSVGYKAASDKRTNNDENITKSFYELDEKATLLGNAYRGVGILIGFLGALIIFSAIAPVAFDLEDTLYWGLGIIEVLSMLSVIALILYDKKSNFHVRWRETRRAAEKIRYRKLLDFIREAERFPTASNIEILRGETLSHLSGEASQISYNYRKSETYHKIELFSENLSWVGFAVALTGAMGHLLFHANWLLVLTVFTPALVGALHGLNSFLKLDDLTSDHEKTAQHLEKLKTRINNCEPGGNERFQLILEVSKMVYKTLVARDEQWVEMAERQGLHAG